MKIPSTMISVICLGAAVIISLGSAWGLDTGALSGDDKGDWYRFAPPSSPEGLSPEGPFPYEGGGESIWITDLDGKERRTALEIPMGAWARLMIAPSSEGDLELNFRYPTGTVQRIPAGSVETGRLYSSWFQAEWPGKYLIWFSLDGEESEPVRLEVQEELIVFEGAGPAAPGSYAAGGPGLGGPAMYAAPAASPSIGFAVGGAKDIENFRENIELDYLPLPTDVTYEGLFYDYSFETGQKEECQKLFCPTYSSAISRDPISGQTQRYLSVGLNSGISDFARKKLNLVVVLDYSGSMGSPFNEYYYDRFGSRVDVEGDSRLSKSKMEIADRAVVELLGHLEGEDRFGLVVFSDEAYLVDPLTRIDDKDLDALKAAIIEIEEYGGTNMEAGMMKGTAAFGKYGEFDPVEGENRIIFITDAMPNLGETGEGGLLRILRENARKGIYTTFIGVGVDFNTELVEEISKVRGANYYSVHSAKEFEERMDEEFDFMVTPLVFDLLLRLEAPGYRIDKVYGSPEADEATGEIMRVNTLFPSRAEEGEVKGGIILIKLSRISDDPRITLSVSYRDRNGTEDGAEAGVIFPEVEGDFYENDGIRKAILLSRYADLLKNWIIDERSALDQDAPVEPSVTLEDGIVVPGPLLGEWERQSLPLTVSEGYRVFFELFRSHFETESAALGDPDLQQEVVVLNKLSGGRGEDR